MDITVDESLPEDSTERWTMYAFGDGKPGSGVFTVPPHWHKVLFDGPKSSQDMLTCDGRTTPSTSQWLKAE